MNGYVKWALFSLVLLLANMVTGSTPSVIHLCDPIDGSILHKGLGKPVATGVEIELRGSAPADLRITVDGLTAQRDTTNFIGKAVLQQRENTVKVAAWRNDTKIEENSVRLILLENSCKRYRVVIDDNSYFLRDITQKQYSSLFDCFYLKMLQELHQKFGAKFTLNIYYTTGDDWNLTQFPDKYKHEWEANSDWLRLAFHAYADKPDKPYEKAPVEKLMADMNLVNKEILRFAGQSAFSPPVVIHWGMTIPEAWKPLYDSGSRVLGGYFRFRNGEWGVNYNLDHYRSTWLSQNDLLKDYDSGIVFSRVDMVINATPTDKVVPGLEKVTADPRLAEVVDLLTHEQYFWPFDTRFIPEHKQRMELAISFLTSKGYKPIFLQNLDGK